MAQWYRDAERERVVERRQERMQALEAAARAGVNVANRVDVQRWREARLLKRIEAKLD
jgi:hypothetical protein